MDIFIPALIGVVSTGVYFLYFREFVDWRQIQDKDIRKFINLRNRLDVFVGIVSQYLTIVKEYDKGRLDNLDFGFAKDVKDSLLEIFDFSRIGKDVIGEVAAFSITLDLIAEYDCIDIEDNNQIDRLEDFLSSGKNTIESLDKFLKEKKNVYMSFDLFLKDRHPTIDRIKSILYLLLNIAFSRLLRLIDRRK